MSSGSFQYLKMGLDQLIILPLNSFLNSQAHEHCNQITSGHWGECTRNSWNADMTLTSLMSVHRLPHVTRGAAHPIEAKGHHSCTDCKQCEPSRSS